MKKMILAIVALMMSATMMAQEGEKQMPKKKPADKTEMVKQRTDMMVERYGLDEKQAEKLLTLNTEFADKMGHGMHMGRPGKMMGGHPQGRPEGRPEGRPQGRPQGRPDFKPEQMDSMRAKMRENREAYDASLKEIMNEEQFKSYKADEQKRMERMGGGHQGRPNMKK